MLGGEGHDSGGGRSNNGEEGKAEEEKAVCISWPMGHTLFLVYLIQPDQIDTHTSTHCIQISLHAKLIYYYTACNAA